jgi:hypothetical protein
MLTVSHARRHYLRGAVRKGSAHRRDHAEGDRTRSMGPGLRWDDGRLPLRGTSASSCGVVPCVALHLHCVIVIIPKKHQFNLAVTILAAPIAVYMFDWAGFKWADSFWGWLIFLSSDAGITSFVSGALSIAIILIKPTHRHG